MAIIPTGYCPNKLGHLKKKFYLPICSLTYCPMFVNNSDIITSNSRDSSGNNVNMYIRGTKHQRRITVRLVYSLYGLESTESELFNLVQIKIEILT